MIAAVVGLGAFAAGAAIWSVPIFRSTQMTAEAVLLYLIVGSFLMVIGPVLAVVAH